MPDTARCATATCSPRMLHLNLKAKCRAEVPQRIQCGTQIINTVEQHDINIPVNWVVHLVDYAGVDDDDGDGEDNALMRGPDKGSKNESICSIHSVR